jgi:peptide/nickel transport system permease protein
VLRRFATVVATVVSATLLVFLLLRTLPGDLAVARLGTDGDPAALDALREAYGLDRPLAVQYLDWLWHAARGDLGTSMLSGADVAAEIARKSAVTLPLILASSLVALAVALPLGALAGLRARRWDGAVLSAASQLGAAIPPFWIGLVLVTVVAVQWRALPAGGFPVDGWSDTAGALRSLVLPSVTLGAAQAAILVRFVRSSTVEALGSGWLRTARATGLGRAEALRVHGARAIALPVVSVLGVQVSTLVAGSIVIEQVFALPGIGAMLVRDVGLRDHVKVQGTVAVIVVAVLLVSALADAAATRLDGRRVPA